MGDFHKDFYPIWLVQQLVWYCFYLMNCILCNEIYLIDISERLNSPLLVPECFQVLSKIV